jgi:hypothetical protein
MHPGKCESNPGLPQLQCRCRRRQESRSRLQHCRHSWEYPGAHDVTLQVSVMQVADATLAASVPVVVATAVVGVVVVVRLHAWEVQRQQQELL